MDSLNSHLELDYIELGLSRQCLDSPSMDPCFIWTIHGLSKFTLGTCSGYCKSHNVSGPFILARLAARPFSLR